MTPLVIIQKSRCTLECIRAVRLGKSNQPQYPHHVQRKHQQAAGAGPAVQRKQQLLHLKGAWKKVVNCRRRWQSMNRRVAPPQTALERRGRSGHFAHSALTSESSLPAHHAHVMITWHHGLRHASMPWTMDEKAFGARPCTYWQHASGCKSICLHVQAPSRATCESGQIPHAASQAPGQGAR